MFWCYPFGGRRAGPRLGGQGVALGKILGLARMAALGLAFALAGCVTAENSLSQNDIAGMKLTAVTVSFAPNSFVNYENIILALGIPKTIPDDQITATARTPEGKAYLQGLLAPRIKAGIEKVMAGQLNGSWPVRLEVVVKSFALAGAVQSVLIGGNRGITADANLVDARTGALVIANPKSQAYLPAGGGLVGTAVQAAIDNAAEQNPADKLINLYGENYRNWLLRQS
jgi:hypothetical protein